jgi:hypothetical protein
MFWCVSLLVPCYDHNWMCYCELPAVAHSAVLSRSMIIAWLAHKISKYAADFRGYYLVARSLVLPRSYPPPPARPVNISARARASDRRLVTPPPWITVGGRLVCHSREGGACIFGPWCGVRRRLWRPVVYQVKLMKHQQCDGVSSVCTRSCAIKHSQQVVGRLLSALEFSVHHHCIPKPLERQSFPPA